MEKILSTLTRKTQKTHLRTPQKYKWQVIFYDVFSFPDVTNGKCVLTVLN